jgi:hypothetical protein
MFAYNYKVKTVKKIVQCLKHLGPHFVIVTDRSAHTYLTERMLVNGLFSVWG